MRIDKERGEELLRREMSMLEAQMGRCAHQAGKLAAFSVGDLQGKGVSALEGGVRMQRAVTTAHMLYFQSLLLADRKNAEMLRALPTTSPGIVDTDYALECLERARRQRQDLVERRDEARRMRGLRQGGSWVMGAAPIWSPNDLSFDRLIACQDELIAHNEQILEQVRCYERDVARAYGAVDVACLNAAMRGLGSLARGDWGDESWVEGVALRRRVQAQGSFDELEPQGDVLEQFVRGELASKDSLWLTGFEESLGIASLRGSVDVLGYEASVGPYGTGKGGVDSDRDAAVGAESTMGGHVAHESIALDIDIVHVKNESYAGTGSVGMALGISSIGGPVPLPSLTAKAQASGAAVSSQTSGRVGEADFNYHAKAKGEAFAAKTEACLSVGSNGLEAKVGAEAYAVTGEISGGITFLGISVDTTLVAKVAGAGGNAGLGVSPSAVEGELGIGLGLGLATKVKVDWSGALGALDRTGRKISSWWDQIAGREGS